ncbi:MAG: phage tail protein [Negativicutes bacterium]|nr:phage tail protein [Negativicutes bacterium]
MITITLLKNPFNHHDREVHACEHVPGTTAYEYVQPYILGLDDFVVSVNGNITEDAKEQIINDEDWIAVFPVVGKSGSDWFRNIFTIALAVWTASPSFTSFTGMSTAMSNSFLGRMIAAGVNMIGGALINHWFPPAKVDRPTVNVNPAYNWNVQSQTGQGNALAVTYGTMRTAGQILVQHVSSDEDNQYLNILLCGGEGPIDDISDIRINDNPIADYKGVTCETRLGVNDQAVIANFNDTYVDQELAYELITDNNWATQQTEGNAVEGLEITLQFPNGLYYVNDDSSLGNASVTVQAQYQKVGDANWTNFTDGTSWSVTQSPLGQLNVLSVSPTAPREIWTITYVGPAWQPNGTFSPGHFTVAGSVSGVQPNANFYENYNNGLIAFNITGRAAGIYVGFLLSGAPFTIDVKPNINLAISAAKNTTFQRTYRVDNLPAAQYAVRAMCTAKSGTSTRFSTRVFWTQLSDILYDDFARPGKALVGIRALATSQLSGGMPSITWQQTRSNVWVWNPDIAQYEQKSATNPAWAAYDMIHRCRQIKNINTGSYEFVVQGAPASRAVYQDFVNWAAFCDSANLSFNFIFDTATDLWSALQKPEGVGRGRVIMRGTRYGCVCDAPGEPVQLFTVGNMITDKFKESFMGLKDRANAIEISFTNRDKDYQKDVITAYADDYDGATEPNITQITLDGATTVKQAYREGKYRLRLNQYLQRTVDHSADIDAIACQINDVVLLAHDVPQWGFSGRLLNATATILQLDRQVTMQSDKSYAVAVQITNPAATTAQAAQSIITASVRGVAEETTTDTVILTSPLPGIPQKWDLYSFGETNKVVKPFRVLNISRDQDMRRKISCIEYIEEIYDEATDIPEIDYSSLTAPVANNVSGLSAEQVTWMTVNGTVSSQINLSWQLGRGDYADKFVIMLSNDNVKWTVAKETTAFSESIDVQPYQTYYIMIITVKGLSRSSGTSIGPVSTGRDSVPPDVQSIQLAQLANNVRQFHWSYTYPEPNDVAGFAIRANQGTLPFWENAIPLHTGVLTQQPFETAGLLSGTWCVMIKAVDNAGNLSGNAAHCIVSLGPDVVDHLLLSTDYYERGWSGVKTGCYVDGDGYLAANPPGEVMFSSDPTVPMYSNLNARMFAANYGSFTYQDTFTLAEAANMSVAIDCDGVPQLWYQSPFPQPMFTGSNDPMFTNPGGPMWMPGQWIPYTSKVQLAAGTYNLKVTMAAGSIWPRIRSLVVNVDTPTITEIINDVAVPASGTRLPLRKSFDKILSINVSIQSGTSAVGFLTVDKQTTVGAGPEIVLVDTNGTPTAGTIDATIQGI